MYNTAGSVLVLSLDDQRVLQKFCKSKIELISISSLMLNDVNPTLNEVAVVSDWRRNENLHGILSFFKSSKLSMFEFASELRITLYGFGSNRVADAMSRLKVKNLRIIDKGSFVGETEIVERFLLVPIIHGAGIKTKVLEALMSRRFVLGTKEAFIGLPFSKLSRAVRVVNDYSDLVELPCYPNEDDFLKISDNLRSSYCEIGFVLTN